MSVSHTPKNPRAFKLKARIQRYQFIFFSLLILILLMAFGVRAVTELLLFTLVSLAGVTIAAEKRHHLLIALCLSVPWLLLAGTAIVIKGQLHAPPAGTVFGAAFLGYTIHLILRHLLRAREVTTDILIGACAIYLMLGVLWSLVYRLILTFDPAAFGDLQPDTETLVYYSFTTLTTLGYGDISPVSPLARTAAILEAITGVFYTTLLLARLVGIYLAGVIQKR